MVDGNTLQRTLSEKISHLFEMVRAEDGRKLTVKQAVALIREAGAEVSESHLSELRRGVKDNPTIRVLEALAGVFQVPVAYLLRDEPDVVALVDSRLELREAMRQAKVLHISHAPDAGMSSNQQIEINRFLTRLIRDDVVKPAANDRGAR
ncbi:hypothetical protein [Pseudonocardia xishanensis]|uniref:hypothetical protein n=1 Tax=Pseudonocardia xishanensis TaxID=630995 RepID=UPI0031E97703